MKESRIDMIVHSFELFKMNSDESISSIFTRFTESVNSLKSLGKTYTNSEFVRKILRCLPKNWEAKITAIIEAKNLSTLGLDELMGSLMTHEITMKGHEDVENKRKVELHSKPHQMKKNMKTPVKMKAQVMKLKMK